MVRYHSGQAAQWLDICGRNGITLNPEKFIFAQDVVEFAGFEITNDTVCPCRRYLRAITEFPTPKNITDVRSWFGLFNQVAYAFSMAERMLPFGDLFKPATPFHWNNIVLTNYLRNPKLQLLLKLTLSMGRRSLIRLSQHALQLIGLEIA